MDEEETDLDLRGIVTGNDDRMEGTQDPVRGRKFSDQQRVCSKKKEKSLLKKK